MTEISDTLVHLVSCSEFHEDFDASNLCDESRLCVKERILIMNSSNPVILLKTKPL